ncbi:MAG: hypothetical protein BMS9Abin28_0330 [Anaerolineae bacterium]|nr:MAG: hypothetical protein BMS9Abin28_0330 [Anaerolineae bacterium]
MYAENELLFPSHVIPKLRESRGEAWAKLVDRVSRLPENHPESLAFSLMMIRLDGCMACETDSYRAMKGCLGCALQTLRRFKGSDQELLQRDQEALMEVEEHLESVPTAPLYIAARAA